MRDDLDFLYQKAMRSKDLQFIAQVAGYLWNNEDWERFHELNYRGINLATLDTNLHGTKFDFLIGDSQRGADWYRNR